MAIWAERARPRPKSDRVEGQHQYLILYFPSKTTTEKKKRPITMDGHALSHQFIQCTALSILIFIVLLGDAP